MILTRTKSPQPILTQPPRQTMQPKTEAEYARLLDALCAKEGKRGKLPGQREYHGNQYTHLYAHQYDAIMAMLPATFAEIVARSGLTYKSASNRVQKLKAEGKIDLVNGMWRKK